MNPKIGLLIIILCFLAVMKLEASCPTGTAQDQDTMTCQEINTTLNPAWAEFYNHNEE